MPELEKNEVVEYGRDDLEFFSQYVLSRQHTCEPSPFHRDLWTMLLSKEPKAVVAAPRHHGKSTICSFDFPIHSGCYGYERPILLISNTATFAEKWLTDVKNEFEQNEEILQNFGDLRGKVWRTDELWFTNGAKIFSRLLVKMVSHQTAQFLKVSLNLSAVHSDRNMVSQTTDASVS